MTTERISPAASLDLSGLPPLLRRHTAFRDLVSQIAAGETPRYPLASSPLRAASSPRRWRPKAGRSSSSRPKWTRPGSWWSKAAPGWAMTPA